MRISRYHKNFQKKELAPDFRANERITSPEVRIIDENGEFLGVKPTAEAIKMAEERGFDLVEVNPTANPPVVKLLNYGQFKYEREKQLKKQKMALKQVEVKGIRLSTRIGQHDLEMRRDQALKFFAEGNKIKIEIILRGRERQHSDLAFRAIHNFINMLKTHAEVTIEQLPTSQGGKIFAIVGATLKKS